MLELSHGDVIVRKDSLKDPMTLNKINCRGVVHSCNCFLQLKRFIWRLACELIAKVAKKKVFLNKMKAQLSSLLKSCMDLTGHSFKKLQESDI